MKTAEKKQPFRNLTDGQKKRLPLYKKNSKIAKREE